MTPHERGHAPGFNFGMGVQKREAQKVFLHMSQLLLHVFAHKIPSSEGSGADDHSSTLAVDEKNRDNFFRKNHVNSQIENLRFD